MVGTRAHCSLLVAQAKITPKYDPKATQTNLAESAFTRRRELFVGRLAVRHWQSACWVRWARLLKLPLSFACLQETFN